MEQLVARQAHNLEVVRSSRAPATKRANMEYNRSNAAVLLCVFPAIRKIGRTKVRQCITGVFQNQCDFLVAKNVKKRCTSATRKNRLSDVIPYTLPQLHTCKTWYVDFFCFDPVVGTMRRKKYHLDPYKTISERKARATEIITSVTARLRSGWIWRF